MMKPLIKYRGGKSRELPQILPHLPLEYERYIEPFFGGGALFFALQPQQAILNDINSKLIGFYRGARDCFETLRAELDELEALYTHNRALFEDLKRKHPDERVLDANEALYYQLRDSFNGLASSQYSEAALYYYINKTAYSGMIRYNTKGEFNVPYGRYQRLNTSSLSREHSELLQRADIYEGDYKAIFDLARPNDFIFLDPPYDCAFSDYGNAEYQGGFGEAEHRRLAEDFRRLPCPAMMVIGRTELTESLYGDLVVDEYAKSYAVNIRNRFKASASHILITNYPSPKGELFI